MDITRILRVSIVAVSLIIAFGAVSMQTQALEKPIYADTSKTKTYANQDITQAKAPPLQVACAQNEQKKSEKKAEKRKNKDRSSDKHFP